MNDSRLLRLPNEIIGMIIRHLPPVDIAHFVQSSTLLGAYRQAPIQRDIRDQHYDSLCFACLNDDQTLAAQAIALGARVDVVFCRSDPPNSRVVEDVRYFEGLAVYPRPRLHSGAPCSPIAKAVMADSLTVMHYLLYTMGADITLKLLAPAIPKATTLDVICHVPHPSILVHARSPLAFLRLTPAGALTTINDIGVNGLSAIEMVLYTMEEERHQANAPTVDEDLAYDRVEQLLDRGAVVQVTRPMQRRVPNSGRSHIASSPLMAAVTIRSPRLFRLILDHGGFHINSSNADLRQLARFIRGSVSLPGRQRDPVSDRTFRKQLMNITAETLQPPGSWFRRLAVDILSRKARTWSMDALRFLIHRGWVEEKASQREDRLVWAVMRSQTWASSLDNRPLSGDAANLTSFFAMLDEFGLNLDIRLRCAPPFALRNVVDSPGPHPLFLATHVAIPLELFRHLLEAGCQPRGFRQMLRNGPRYSLVQCLLQLHAQSSSGFHIPWGIDGILFHRHSVDWIYHNAFQNVVDNVRAKMECLLEVADAPTSLFHVESGEHVMSWAFRELHGPLLELALVVLPSFWSRTATLEDVASSPLLQLLSQDRFDNLLSFGDLATVEQVLTSGQVHMQSVWPSGTTTPLHRLCQLSPNLGSQDDWHRLMGRQQLVPFAFSHRNPWSQYGMGEFVRYSDTPRIRYDELRDDQPLYERLRRHHMARMIRWCVEEGRLDLSARDEHGRTALSYLDNVEFLQVVVKTALAV